MMVDDNRVRVCGCLESAPVFNHQCMGEKFFSSVLLVKRLSGVVDRLPVMFPEKLLEMVQVEPGRGYLITGQVRTYNTFVNGAVRLLVTIFALTVVPEDAESTLNEVQLVGVLCKPPIHRMTSFGREISDLMLAVNRSFGKSDYIPCVAWGMNSRWVAGYTTGDKFVMAGRLQSREYQKGLPDGTQETRTAIELSTWKIEYMGAVDGVAKEASEA